MSSFPESLLLIGYGKMGGALLRAWHNAGMNKKIIAVVDKAASSLGVLQSIDDVKIIPECVVLAVKPQSMDEVLPQLKNKFGTTPFYISIAAGKTISYFEEHLGAAAIVRAMPNTPALIGKGITALCANKKTNQKQKEIASALLQAAGEAIWLNDESLMNAVTAISGSGPAYVFLFLEALIEAGKSYGLPENICRQLAIQTVLGSAELAKLSKEPLAKLRADVTSKGGTTEAALTVLEDSKFKTILSAAVGTAVERAKKLA